MIAFRKIAHESAPKSMPVVAFDRLEGLAIGEIAPKETRAERQTRTDTSGARRRMRETVESNRLL